MDRDEERSLAARLYNASWELLEQSERSIDQDVALLTNAFASKFHWGEVGGPQQWIIGEWMVARAAAGTGWAPLSLFFARRAFDAAEALGGPDWLVASTAEGVARAYRALNEQSECELWCRRAADLVDAIVNDEDRSIIAEQLASVLI